MARRTSRRRSASGFCSEYIFNSHFEEKKICKYLINLIRSKFYSFKPQKLFAMVCTFIGTSALTVLHEKHPDLITQDVLNDLAGWESQEYERLSQKLLPVNVQQLFLKEDALPILSERFEQLSKQKPSEMDKRFDILQETFRLSSAEMAVISLRYLINACQFLCDGLSNNNRLIDFTDSSVFKSHGDAILGISKASISEVFGNYRLFDMNVLKFWSNRTFDLEDWCVNYLSGLGDRDLAFDFFTKENRTILSPADFDLPADELLIVEKLIQTEKPHNILLYGPPGTGKTSFAQSLAKHYGKELLTVKTPKDDNHKDRIQAIYATINFTGSDKPLVLVDEADNLLNTYNSFFFKSQTNKSWINNFLETHDQKIIWITNRLSEIDPSTMRRFSFALEFKTLNKNSRLRVLRSELTRHGFAEYFTEDDLRNLCDSYSVNADGIVKAIDMLQACSATQKDRLIPELKTILSNHEKVMTMKRQPHGKKRDLASYSLEGLNTSHDLEGIIAVAKRYVSGKNGTGGNVARSLTLLLHGLPGTGKTEFVYYLGEALGKEVVIRRCSEIESMWVGQTEKNIAEAFHEAQGSGDILFFDEADSFLFPRRDARNSWEKTFTNEMLAQLDNYTGIAVFATNEIEGLDNAAIRRFKFKIEFRPLTPEGNLHFYNAILSPLARTNGGPDRKEMLAIAEIPNLTPGDFAVVRDQFSLEEPANITHKRLILSLTVEASHKAATKKIGFLAH
ncbi:MAG: ATP-binding protein [Syntrophorhabdaceae bacterium]|nr:ATP-binding protein [Syntrophorhabdaceae bacterium]MDD5242655.1 ATP-binding protein [Syntrophorhabdaceae bacterium]